MEALILALSPFVTSLLTEAVSRLYINPEIRKPFLQTLVAVFALGTAAANYLLTGTPIDNELVTVLAYAVVSFLGAFGVHALAFKRRR